MFKGILSLFMLGLVSTVCFGGNYFHRNNIVVDRYNVVEKVVEFDADYFYGTHGYYSVGQKLRAERDAKVDEEKAYLRGKIDALEEFIKNNFANGASNGGNQPTPADEPKPTDDLDSKVLSLFEKYNCVTCHNDKQTDGGLQLVNGGSNGYQLEKLSAYDKFTVWYRSEATHLEDGDARMPKGGKPVEQEDEKILHSWFKKGLEEEFNK